MMRAMVIDKNDEQLHTLAELQAFLAGTVAVDFAVATPARYDFIARTVRRFGYGHLKRAFPLACYPMPRPCGGCHPPSADSSRSASASATCSCQGRAVICTPIGSPAQSAPARTTVPGQPHRLKGRV